MIDKKWKWVAKGKHAASMFIFKIKPDMSGENGPTSACYKDWKELSTTVFPLIEGDWKDSLHEIIHHEDGKIEFRKARPELKVDDPVLVRSNVEHGWVGRHFAGWTDQGRIVTWEAGRTSFTAVPNREVWKYYKLP